MRERWGSWVRLGEPSEYYASMTLCEEREGECSMEAWQTVMQLKESCAKWSGRWAQAHPWRKTVSPRDGSVLICLPYPVCGWWQSTWEMASHKPCWEFQSSVARTLTIYTPQTGRSAKCILMTMTSWVGSSRQWVPRCLQWPLCKGNRLMAEAQDHLHPAGSGATPGLPVKDERNFSNVNSMALWHKSKKTWMLMALVRCQTALNVSCSTRLTADLVPHKTSKPSLHLPWC